MTAVTASWYSLALLAALGTVSACGRKAPLDTPYAAAVQARKDAQKAGEPLPRSLSSRSTDKPFILDRLI